MSIEPFYPRSECFEYFTVRLSDDLLMLESNPALAKHITLNVFTALRVNANNLIQELRTSEEDWGEFLMALEKELERGPEDQMGLEAEVDGFQQMHENILYDHILL